MSSSHFVSPPRACLPRPYWRKRASLAFALGLVMVATTSAHAQVPPFAKPPPDAGAKTDVAPCNAPVPAQAEAPPVRLSNGGFCFDGPHPTDTSAAAGPPWDNAPGRHTHFYPPVDTRLFVLRNDCYHFIGDPHDFGFDGETQAYYGTHPIAGGGWCFMIGGHQHSFSPFSPQFVMVGPWIHWQGEYDTTFWAQWPYYSAFYKDLYPRFYGGQQWAKQRKVAPPLPAGAWTNRPAAVPRAPKEAVSVDAEIGSPAIRAAPSPAPLPQAPRRTPPNPAASR